MAFKTKRNVDLSCFDEDDWLFEGVDSDEHYVEAFSMALEGNVTKRGRFLNALGVAICVVASCVAIGVSCREFFIPDELSEPYKEEVVVVYKGVDASTTELIDVSKVLGEYTHTLKENVGLSNLNALCLDGSLLNRAEAEYRSKMEYNRDMYDSKARGLRGFASNMSLARVKAVTVEDGVYYCYASMSVPDLEQFWEYYLTYSYEITKYFNTRDITNAEVCNYITKQLEQRDIPIKYDDVVFELERTQEGYKLKDDSYFCDLCVDCYNSSVINITDLVSTNARVEVDSVDKNLKVFAD